MRLSLWVAVLSLVMVAKTLSAGDEKAPAVPAVRSAASYVQPIDLAALAKRYRSLPERDRELFRLYLEGAQRYVLSREDGAFPDAGGEHWRNIAERAHGAAVLSLLPNDWPVELNDRCQQQLIDSSPSSWPNIREPLFLPPGAKIAAALQASWWAGEWAPRRGFSGINSRPPCRTTWRTWSCFMPTASRPKRTGQSRHGKPKRWPGTHASCRSRSTCSPRHPHNPQWQDAAKRYAYTIFATPRDHDGLRRAMTASRSRMGRSQRIRDDYALENHNRFHIDYVMTCTTGSSSTAKPYRRAAIRCARRSIITRDVWEQVLLPCTDGSKFAVFVSDNDWKRYHPWTESPAADGFIALTESSPLASAMEEASLRNAVDYWRQRFPKDFAFPNPYVCGKAWTPRIADIALIHLLSPLQPLPEPLPRADVETKLVGVHQKRDIGLVTQYSPAGSFRSFYWEPGPVVRHVQPKDDPASVLPISTNFVPLLDGKPAEGAETKSFTGKGDNWFWVLRRDPRGVQEAFVSLPNESVVMLSAISAAALKGVKRIDSVVTVEKPYDKIVATFAGGRASYRFGEAKWDRSDRETGLELKTNWINLNETIGYVALNLSQDAPPMILPKPGERGALHLHHLANLGHDLSIATIALPNHDRVATEVTAMKVSASRSGDSMSCMPSPFYVWANFGDQEDAVQVPAAVEGTISAKAPPHSVVILQEDRDWAPLK
jgi:hypothetical protein